MRIEEFHVGQSYSKNFEITEKMGEMFAEISGDKNPIHLNCEYAKKTIFGKKIVHGMLVVSFISGILGNDFPGVGTVYLNQEINFKKPIYYNEVISINVEVEEIDEKRRRLTLKTDCLNKEGITCFSGKAIVMLS